MKKTTPFVILLLYSILSFSQSFNYQAVVRDAAGDLVANQSVGVQVQILEGAAPDTVVYTETHTVISSAQGVIVLLVGTGTTSDNFSDINWNLQSQWIGIAVDIAGGTTYTNIGISKLQQVPYALYAASSGDKTFTTTANVTSNTSGDIATDDFVFGSTQLNNDPTTTDDNAKFFFDKSKAAFRVGRLRDLDPVDPEDNEPGDQWDDANVGEESIALGNSTAAGNNSIAIGNFNNLNSSANESVAIGRGNNISAGGSFAFGSGNTIDYGGSTAIGLANTSSGLGATAIGFVTHAGSYSEIVIGLNSTVVNGTKDNYVATDRLFVIGNGISVLQRRDALVMLKNGNTTLNGQLTLDADNAGAGRSYTLPAQDGTANQVMSTDGAGNVSWVTNNGTNTGLEQITEGSNTGWRLAESDPANYGDIGYKAVDLSISEFPTTDSGATGLYAVAIGQRVIASGRNSIAIGDAVEASSGYATAIGYGNVASGFRSFAAGESSTASASSSTAIGYNATASGRASVALGRGTTASGVYATSTGFFTNAASQNSFAIGRFNIGGGTNDSWVATDPLFEIGNGSATTNKSNALTILKNGNTTLNGQLTIDGDNQGAGTSYTLPAQDGTANQVMSTDGAGNVSWIDYALESVSSPVFNTGWENYSVAHGNGFEDARYYIDNGRVYLGGLIRKTSGITVGEVMLTLPTGYRPSKQRIFTASTEAGIVRVDVAANGTVIYNAPAHNGGQNWVSLDGISFRID